MIDIVILCPIAVEYNAVRKHLNNLSAQKLSQFGLSYEFGQFQSGKKKWNIALFETGSHIANLNIKTSQVLHSLHPSYLFLIGVSGGIKDVAIGDLVIGTKAYGYEHGKVSQKGFEGRPNVIPFSQDLIDEAKQLNREEPESSYNIIFGAINSGDKVVANSNSEQYQIIKKHYGDTIAIEMESIGFADAASKVDKVKFINIRGVSDLIDNKSQSDKEGNQPTAALRAADFTFRLIKRLRKQKNSKTIQKQNVYYTSSPFSVFSWRTFKTTELYISDFLLSFEIDQKPITVSKIYKLEHTSMKGDFGKNWVKIELPDEREFYFSKKSLFHGLGNIIGGSGDLFKQLNRFVINT